MSDERTDPQPATPACDGMAEDSGSGPSAREGEAGPAPRGRERGYAARRRRRRAAALTPSGRPALQPPGGRKKVLLHSCCAPCSGEVMEAMTESGIDYTIFFYNPNIHPEREYLLRKEENVRFAEAHGIPFVDADYDRDNWFERAKGMEWEPERGIRCTMCFDMRFERAALYAHEHDFPVMTSSLGISRWKNMAQINECGMRAVAPYEGLDYWDFNWRKGGGSARMIEISKRERFYKQEYCGCAYSLRDTNNFRRAKGRPAIVLGEEFYGEED